MFILKKGHQPGVYLPLRALFLVLYLLKAKSNFTLIMYIPFTGIFKP